MNQSFPFLSHILTKAQPSAIHTKSNTQTQIYLQNAQTLHRKLYSVLTFIPPIIHSFSTFFGSYLSLQCDWIEDVLAQGRTSKPDNFILIKVTNSFKKYTCFTQNRLSPQRDRVITIQDLKSSHCLSLVQITLMVRLQYK